MSYPSFEEYTDALRLPPHVVFQDPLLVDGSVRKNAAGVPFARSGNFALTYEVAVNGSRYAVRCFHKESDSLERRYEAISRKLKTIPSPWFVDFDFQPAGIRTESGQFPIVRMEWAEGCSLAQFISEHRDEPQTLLQLRDTLRDLARHLQAHDIAHGDIQPGNIIVRSASDLKLVDYDGMFVPELEPWGGTELGQRNFQHPGRSWLHYDERLDRFSFALLDVVLEALAMQPALWELTGSDEASIVLRAADFLDPGASTAFGVLAELDGLGIRARQLAVLCRSPFERVPALDDFLAGRRIPASGPLALTTNANAARPPYVPAYAVLNATNFARCCAHIGDRIELIGQVRRVVRESTSDTGREYLRVEFGDGREDMVRLSIWPEAGLETLAALEPGQWLSALGLVDPILTEAGESQPQKSVSIAISERSQVRLLTQGEALHRLAANEGPTHSDQDIAITIGTDPAIPGVWSRPSPAVSPLNADVAHATPTVALPDWPAAPDPPGDLTTPIESIPVLEPLITLPPASRSAAPARLERSFSATDPDATVQLLPTPQPLAAVPPVQSIAAPHVQPSFSATDPDATVLLPLPAESLVAATHGHTRSTDPPRVEPSFSATDPDATVHLPLTREPIVAASTVQTRSVEPQRLEPSFSATDPDVTVQLTPTREPIVAAAPVQTRPIEPPRFAGEPVAESHGDVGGQSTARPESIVVPPVVTRPITPPKFAIERDRKTPAPSTAAVAAVPHDPPAPVTSANVASGMESARPAGPATRWPSGSAEAPATGSETVRRAPHRIDWPLRWPAVRMPGMRWAAFGWPAIRLPAFRLPTFRWPALRWPTVRWPAVRWPTVRTPAVARPAFRIRMPEWRWPAKLQSLGTQSGRRFAAVLSARWSTLRKSLAARPLLRIENPLPRLKAALEGIRLPAGLPDRLRTVHPAWWLATALAAVVLVQSWIIARKPEITAALEDRAAGSGDAMVQPANPPHTPAGEQAANADPPASARQGSAAPAAASTLAGLSSPATTAGSIAARAAQAPRLLAFEYLTSTRRPITTIAGPIDVVLQSEEPRLSLVEVNGKALDESAAALNMLVHRSVYADREVIVGFSDCLAPTPACERKEPFWLLLRRSQPPVFTRSPGLRANRNAGVVTAMPSGVHVDLGLWNGVRQIATLTSLNNIYVTRVSERPAPLSSADCRSVAAVLESCAESRVCDSYEGIIRSVSPARMATVQRLFHETTGLNAAMFRSVCVRSCQLGLTPTDALVRREVCGGAVMGQWSQVTLGTS